MRDDILGVFGSKENMGKPSNSDIMEAKVTILVNSTIEKLERRGTARNSSTSSPKTKRRTRTWKRYGR